MFISRQICFVAFSQLLNGPMLYLPSPLVFVFCPAIHGLCTWFLQKMEREKYNEKYIYQHHFWCSSNMLRHPKPITGLQTHTGYNSRNTMLTNSVKSIKYNIYSTHIYLIDNITVHQMCNTCIHCTVHTNYEEKVIISDLRYLHLYLFDMQLNVMNLKIF